MNHEKAYPSQEIDFNETIIQGKTIYENQHLGMDLRDYFAAKAMQSLILIIHSENGFPLSSVVSKRSYQIADAMLQERNEIK